MMRCSQWLRGVWKDAMARSGVLAPSPARATHQSANPPAVPVLPEGRDGQESAAKIRVRWCTY